MMDEQKENIPFSHVDVGNRKMASKHPLSSEHIYPPKKRALYEHKLLHGIDNFAINNTVVTSKISKVKVTELDYHGNRILNSFNLNSLANLSDSSFSRPRSDSLHSLPSVTSEHSESTGTTSREPSPLAIHAIFDHQTPERNPIPAYGYQNREISKPLFPPSSDSENSMVGSDGHASPENITYGGPVGRKIVVKQSIDTDKDEQKYTPKRVILESAYKMEQNISNKNDNQLDRPITTETSLKNKENVSPEDFMKTFHERSIPNDKRVVTETYMGPMVSLLGKFNSSSASENTNPLNLKTSGVEVGSQNMLGKSQVLHLNTVAENVKSVENLNIGNEENIEPFKCSECSKSFVSEEILRQHLEMHKERALHCWVCKMEFNGTEKLLHHMKAFHSGQKPYKCQHCSREFGQYNNLRRHLRVHREKKFKCSLCEREFNEEFYLKMHMSTHTGRRVYSCGVCNAGFPSSHELKIHVKTHSPSQLHTCNVCGKSFSKACVLRQHKKGHSGERPHKCDQCLKTFIHRHHLTMHMRSHTDQKLFICDICKKEFAQSSHLYKHLRAHEDAGELNIDSRMRLSNQSDSTANMNNSPDNVKTNLTESQKPRSDQDNEHSVTMVTGTVEKGDNRNVINVNTDLKTEHTGAHAMNMPQRSGPWVVTKPKSRRTKAQINNTRHPPVVKNISENKNHAGSTMPNITSQPYSSQASQPRPVVSQHHSRPLPSITQTFGSRPMSRYGEVSSYPRQPMPYQMSQAPPGPLPRFPYPVPPNPMIPSSVGASAPNMPGFDSMYRAYSNQVQAYYNQMYMMNYLSQNAMLHQLQGQGRYQYERSSHAEVKGHHERSFNTNVQQFSENNQNETKDRESEKKLLVEKCKGYQENDREMTENHENKNLSEKCETVNVDRKILEMKNDSQQSIEYQKKPSEIRETQKNVTNTQEVQDQHVSYDQSASQDQSVSYDQNVSEGQEDNKTRNEVAQQLLKMSSGMPIHTESYADNRQKNVETDQTQNFAQCINKMIERTIKDMADETNSEKSNGKPMSIPEETILTETAAAHRNNTISVTQNMPTFSGHNMLPARSHSNMPVAGHMSGVNTGTHHHGNQITNDAEFRNYYIHNPSLSVVNTGVSESDKSYLKYRYPENGTNSKNINDEIVANYRTSEHLMNMYKALPTPGQGILQLKKLVEHEKELMNKDENNFEIDKYTVKQEVELDGRDYAEESGKVLRKVTDNGQSFRQTSHGSQTESGSLNTAVCVGYVETATLSEEVQVLSNDSKGTSSPKNKMNETDNVKEFRKFETMDKTKNCDSFEGEKASMKNKDTKYIPQQVAEKMESESENLNRGKVYFFDESLEEKVLEIDMNVSESSCHDNEEVHIGSENGQFETKPEHEVGSQNEDFRNVASKNGQFGTESEHVLGSRNKDERVENVASESGHNLTESCNVRDTQNEIRGSSGDAVEESENVFVAGSEMEVNHGKAESEWLNCKGSNNVTIEGDECQHLSNDDGVLDLSCHNRSDNESHGEHSLSRDTNKENEYFTVARTLNVKAAKEAAYLTCGICWLQLRSREELGEHQRNHTEVDGNRCFLCNKTFSRPFDLQWHMLHHREAESKGQTFDEVGGQGTPKVKGQKFETVKSEDFTKFGENGLRDVELENVSRHRTKGGKTEINYFYEKRSFGENILAEISPNGKNRRSSPKKGKKPVDFEDVENIDVSGFMSNPERPFKCDVCLRDFMHKHNLNRHKMSHNLKSHKCNICNRSFKEDFYLQMHLKIHSEEKTRNCEICGVAVPKSDIWAHTNDHYKNIAGNPTYEQIGHRVKEILREQT